MIWYCDRGPRTYRYRRNDVFIVLPVRFWEAAAPDVFLLKGTVGMGQLMLELSSGFGHRWYSKHTLPLHKHARDAPSGLCGYSGYKVLCQELAQNRFSFPLLLLYVEVKEKCSSVWWQEGLQNVWHLGLWGSAFVPFPVGRQVEKQLSRPEGSCLYRISFCCHHLCLNKHWVQSERNS